MSAFGLRLHLILKIPILQPGGSRSQDNKASGGSTLVASYGSGDSDEEDVDSEDSKNCYSV